MAKTLTIQKLTKLYAGAKEPALSNLTLHVSEGEVYGFLGANGAGKSTAIRTLLNFLQPTSGSATIFGLDSVTDSVEIKKRVGYLAGDVALWPKATGHEIFSYLAALQGGIDMSYLKDLIQRFEAEPNKRIDELSKGNRQKIGLIQALMHQPDMLILDEPTSGLDPLMQEVFYDTVKEASARGAAVFVSSHNLSEAERMCHRVGIIKKGRLVHEQVIKSGTKLGATTFHVTYKSAAAIEVIKKSPAVTVVSGQGMTLSVQPKGTVEAALKQLAQYPIAHIVTDEPKLEDDFLEYYSSDSEVKI